MDTGDGFSTSSFQVNLTRHPFIDKGRILLTYFPFTLPCQLSF